MPFLLTKYLFKRKIFNERYMYPSHNSYLIFLMTKSVFFQCNKISNKIKDLLNANGMTIILSKKYVTK